MRDKATEDEQRVISYLQEGATLATTGSLVDDALDASQKGVARLEIATDGEWAWPRDLAYYIGRYHVEIPQAFVEHMRSRGWRPPQFGQAELEKLETEFMTLPPEGI